MLSSAPHCARDTIAGAGTTAPAELARNAPPPDDGGSVSIGWAVRSTGVPSSTRTSNECMSDPSHAGLAYPCGTYSAVSLSGESSVAPSRLSHSVQRVPSKPRTWSTTSSGLRHVNPTISASTPRSSTMVLNPGPTSPVATGTSRISTSGSEELAGGRATVPPMAMPAASRASQRRRVRGLRSSCMVLRLSVAYGAPAEPPGARLPSWLTDLRG
jgi:hypothetical protein